MIQKNMGHKAPQTSASEKDGKGPLLPPSTIGSVQRQGHTPVSKPQMFHQTNLTIFAFFPPSLFPSVLFLDVIWGTVHNGISRCSNTHVKFLWSTLLTRMCKPSAPKEKMTEAIRGERSLRQGHCWRHPTDP